MKCIIKFKKINYDYIFFEVDLIGVTITLTPLTSKILTSVPFSIFVSFSPKADHVSPSTLICPVELIEFISSVTIPTFPIIEYTFVFTKLLLLANFLTNGFVAKIRIVEDITNTEV